MRIQQVNMKQKETKVSRYKDRKKKKKANCKYNDIIMFYCPHTHTSKQQTKWGSNDAKKSKRKKCKQTGSDEKKKKGEKREKKRKNPTYILVQQC